MDLKQVYNANVELNNFATKSFRAYVHITHSPALGLLLTVGILIKK